MKPFRIYLNGYGPKQQCVWVGALLLIMGIVAAAIGFGGIYFLKQTILNLDLTIDSYLEAQQQIYQIYAWCGVGGILVGAILLLAGGFAVNGNGKNSK